MEPGHGIAQLILGSPHLSHRLGIAPYPELNLKRCPRPAGCLAKNNSGVSEDRKRLIDSPLRILTTGCRAEVLYFLLSFLQQSPPLESQWPFADLDDSLEAPRGECAAESAVAPNTAETKASITDNLRVFMT